MIKALNRLGLQGKLPSPKKKYILNLKRVAIKKKSYSKLCTYPESQTTQKFIFNNWVQCFKQKILYCNNTEKEIKGKVKERKKLSLFGNGMTMHMKFINTLYLVNTSRYLNTRSIHKN